MDPKIDDIKNLLEKELTKNKITQQVSLEIAKNTPLKDKLNNILEILECSYGLKHTMMLFPNPDHTKMIVFASRGFTDPGIGAEVPFGQGIVGMVAKKKKKIRLSGMRYYQQYAHAAANKSGSVLNTTADETLNTEARLPGLPNVEAQLAFPLIANDELIAILSIESSDKDFFSIDDEHFLHSLTQQMALSIQNAIIINSLEEKVKERTREIERKNSELEHLNATKDKFFSIIGHDLKSPISSLKVATDLIQHYSRRGETEKLSEVGFKISTAINNVNQLLDNLLNWAMNQRDMLKCEPKKIAIKEIISRVADIYKESLAAKEISIINHIPDYCFVFADMNMTMTIFRNVLSNAIKFSNKKGTISITSLYEDPEIRIIVTDQGVGMSEEKIHVLFNLKDKKSTLGTNREKGTGLGMILVKDFMELNSGSVIIESKPGLGTSVTLCFQTDKK
jgi:signal transduction histidine kinase